MSIFTKLGAKALGKTIFSSWITWVVILGMGIIGTLAWQIRGLKDDINNEEDGYIARLSRTNADLQLCKSQKVGLVASLEQQNTAVRKLLDASEELKRKAGTQPDIARIGRERSVSRMAEIDAAMVGKTCEEAMQWLLQQVTESQR